MSAATIDRSLRKVKLAARDKWIGWTAEQRSRRLHLIANNVRFVILPGCSEPNLASRVLGRSLRRLSEDMRGAHGHPVLLAETFVDPALFAGTSYPATNSEAVGVSKGYERVSGGGYREHGQPKTILVRELSRDARALLRGRADDPAWGCASPAPPPEAFEPVRLRSLYDHLRGVPDFRARRGRRHAHADRDRAPDRRRGRRLPADRQGQPDGDARRHPSESTGRAPPPASARPSTGSTGASTSPAAASSNSTKPSTATRGCPDAARRSASSASGACPTRPRRKPRTA